MAKKYGPFRAEVTIGEKYGPAMAITDQNDADEYFDVLVDHYLTNWGGTREHAESIERQNLGYYAGYGSNADRERIERLFRCAHPVFGAIAEHVAPSMAEAFGAGIAAGMHADGKGGF